GLANLTALGATLFFTANDGATGTELWKSDGTTNGTVLVRDIQNGASGSSPTFLMVMGSTLFLRANDGTSGGELWKSDGTKSGTVLVKDIRKGSFSGVSSGFTVVGGKTLFFGANDGTAGTELWKSDGSANGTVLVKDIHKGTKGTTLLGLADLNGTLLFSANDDSSGLELWKSDGSTEGTAMIKDIRPGPGSSYPRWMMAVGSRFAWFVADDGQTGFELWRTDGTAKGTVLTDDINSGSRGSSPSYFTASAGDLIFTADDGIKGTEVWKLSLGAFALSTGAGCGDGHRAPTMAASDPVPGRTMAIWGRNAPVAATGFLFIGLRGPAIPLAANCYAYLRPGDTYLLGPFTTTSGDWRIFLPVPSDTPPGTAMLQAAFAPTASGFELTNGVMIKVSR
ncbi:MAG: ELWxxDGT repeat protein, partial [Planctomycetota bacterium]